ncbi:TPA: RDD family protein, partial [Neisseria gonorrhoeae]
MPSEVCWRFRRHIPIEKMMILKTAPLKRRFAA